MRRDLIRTTGRTCQIRRAYPRSTNTTALSLIGGDLAPGKRLFPVVHSMPGLTQCICSAARSRRSYVAGEGSVPNAVGKYRSADPTAPLRTNEKKDQTFKKK